MAVLTKSRTTGKRTRHPGRGVWAPAEQARTASGTGGAAQTLHGGPPAHRAAGPAADIVDVWGDASFPASDPPANW
ncbi:hypothetical protein FE374_00700 [Georgenia yuyongxinii]|uniref:Uncharacterized protein n=1 Tax=Georgenia yuyongxinii TaxID=2589797 RepID=A0A5B8C1H3_9MICO|nr:hypothetical protein [Georgenia yuyongxinii]QDC23341.1 hypothetical protein FE374_00700 [Georgenia yuyongxinii]